MNLQQFVMDINARHYKELEQTVSGLTAEQLNFQPKPESNSIDWLIWHAARSQDRMNADLFGEDQIWVTAQWYLKFNRLPDQNDTGYGHTPAQVASFKRRTLRHCLITPVSCMTVPANILRQG